MFHDLHWSIGKCKEIKFTEEKMTLLGGESEVGIWQGFYWVGKISWKVDKVVELQGLFKD